MRLTEHCGENEVSDIQVKCVHRRVTEARVHVEQKGHKSPRWSVEVCGGRICKFVKFALRYF